MLLAIDVGNSRIKTAIFLASSKIIFFKKLKTYANYSEVYSFCSTLAKKYDINQICISSVFPKKNIVLKECCTKCFGVSPMFIRRSGKLNFTFEPRSAREAGADIIATNIAAVKTFPNSNVLIISLGTATTFSFIDKKAVFRGVIIAPGVNMLESSLHKKLSKILGRIKPVLSTFEIKGLMPISTRDAVHAGILSTLHGGVENVINSLKNRLQDDELVVVVVGGASKFLSKQTFQKKSMVHYFHLDFTIKGIYHYYQLNK